MKTRTGIFGGSFDPVHSGHIQAAESFLKSNLIHQLLVLLTPTPPHKQNSDQASYRCRFEMLKMAFRDYGNIMISDLETRLSKPSYTLHTLNYLINRNKDRTWFLCVGEDSIVHFDSWYQYKDILKLVPLVVAGRPGFDKESVKPEILERSVFVDHEPVDISSTGIRNRTLKTGEVVPGEVAAYISKHNLYTQALNP